MQHSQPVSPVPGSRGNSAWPQLMWTCLTCFWPVLGSLVTVVDHCGTCSGLSRAEEQETVSPVVGTARPGAGRGHRLSQASVHTAVQQLAPCPHPVNMGWPTIFSAFQPQQIDITGCIAPSPHVVFTVTKAPLLPSLCSVTLCGCCPALAAAHPAPKCPVHRSVPLLPTAPGLSRGLHIAQWET